MRKLCYDPQWRPVCADGLLILGGRAAAGRKTRRRRGQGQAKDYSNAPLVVKMMAFDKNKDGKLTRDEVTDERLLRLFDQADTNKDGVVTKEELMALAAKLDAEGGRGGRGPGGPGGPRGHGGPAPLATAWSRRPGRPGGPGGGRSGRPWRPRRPGRPGRPSPARSCRRSSRMS